MVRSLSRDRHICGRVRSATIPQPANRTPRGRDGVAAEERPSARRRVGTEPADRPRHTRRGQSASCSAMRSRAPCPRRCHRRPGWGGSGREGEEARLARASAGDRGDEVLDVAEPPGSPGRVGHMSASRRPARGRRAASRRRPHAPPGPSRSRGARRRARVLVRSCLAVPSRRSRPSRTTARPCARGAPGSPEECRPIAHEGERSCSRVRSGRGAGALTRVEVGRHFGHHASSQYDLVDPGPTDGARGHADGTLPGRRIRALAGDPERPPLGSGGVGRPRHGPPPRPRASAQACSTSPGRAPPPGRVRGTTVRRYRRTRAATR